MLWIAYPTSVPKTTTQGVQPARACSRLRQIKPLPTDASEPTGKSASIRPAACIQPARVSSNHAQDILAGADRTDDGRVREAMAQEQLERCGDSVRGARQQQTARGLRIAQQRLRGALQMRGQASLG